jgi:hypothetical protein
MSVEVLGVAEVLGVDCFMGLGGCLGFFALVVCVLGTGFEGAEFEGTEFEGTVFVGTC